MSLSRLFSAAGDTRDDLASNLRRLVAEAEDLLADHADSAASDMRSRVRAGMKYARERFDDADELVRARARQAAEFTDDYVHENPWAIIGAAAALGVFLGVLLGRRD